MPLLVKVFPVVNAENSFCIFSVYCSYLSTEGGWPFMSFGHPRGLPEAVRSRDTWSAYGPSSGRQWLAWAWCWATLRGLHPRDSRKTPVLGEVLIR
jgi:hypothetical protein